MSKIKYGFIAGTISNMPLKFEDAKSGIHINPKNKGKFNALKKKTGKSTEELTHSKNPLTKKRAIFAQNAAKWHKGQYGTELEDKLGYAPPQEGNLDSIITPTDYSIPMQQVANNISSGVKGNIQSMQKMGPNPNLSGLGTLQAQKPGFFNPQGGALAQGFGKADKALGPIGGVGGALSLGTDVLQGVQMIKEEKRNKKMAKQTADLSDITLQASSVIPDKPKRKYVRPEDAQFDPYNMSNTYGSGTNYLAGKNGLKVSYAQAGKDVVYTNPDVNEDVMSSINAQGLKVQHSNDFIDDAQKKYGDKWGGYDYINIPDNFSTDKFPSRLKEFLSTADSTGNFPSKMVLKHYGENPPAPVAGVPIKKTTPIKPTQLYDKPYYGSYKDVPKRQFGGITGGYGGALGSKLFGGTGEISGGSKIGGSIGSTVGMLFGPVGEAVGGFLGGAVGGAFSAKGQKDTKGYEDRASANYANMAFGEGARGLHDQYSGYVKHGGNIPTNMDGDIQHMWGGKAEQVSTNPYLPDGGEAIKFNGNSHANGGIGIKFGGSPVEVEGGEPAQKFDNGGETDSLTVFGDMKIPDYGVQEIGDPKAKGHKFKSYINQLNKVEAKQNKNLDKGMTYVNEANPNDRFDLLKFNSGKAISYGADQKLKDIAQKKKIASVVQNSILQTADEFGLESSDLAEGRIKKAKKGALIPYGQDGYDVAQDGKNKKRTPGADARYIAEAEKDYYLKQGYLQDPDNPERLYIDPTPGEDIPGKKGEIYKPRITPWWLSRTPEQKAALNAATKERIAKDPRYKDSPATHKPGKPGDEVWIRNYKPTPPPTGEKPPVKNPEPNVPGIGVGNFLQAYMPYLRPATKLKLGPEQLAGEMYSMATNQLDPVQAQLYNPLLDNVSDVSYQDQLNANQADFRSMETQIQNNPAALAGLAAQKYDANSKVLGQQFRDNQTQRMDVYNRNRATLNDAQLKNLNILDNQYVRQSTAKSNTKAITQAALSSIADKIGQNKRDQRLLNIDEQRYNYRFGPNGMAWNWNGPAQFNTNGAPSNYAKVQYLDDQGKVIKTEENNTYYDRNGLPIRREDKEKVQTSNKKNGGLVKAFKI